MPVTQLHVLVPGDGGTVDVDVRMPVQDACQHDRADALLEHAHLQRAHPVDHLEGLVRVQEGALDVVDVPEERLVPAVGPLAPVGPGSLGDEHALVARNHHARRRGARPDQVLRVGVDHEVGALERILPP